MAHRAQLIASALIVAALIVGGNDNKWGIAASQSAHAAQHERWRAALIRDLRPGDIAFRRGVGALSRTVSHFSAYAGSRETRWTHVGIAVRPGGSEKIYILHAIDGRGVVLDTPEKFYSPDEAVAGEIRRIGGSEKAAYVAMQFVGRPFDAEFSLSDHTAMYCTELVLTALKAAGTPVEVILRKVPLVEENIAFPDDLADALNNDTT